MSDLALATDPTCPACERAESTQFYVVRGVPVHQVRLVRTRQEALACPKGDIGLRYCRHCGFVWNAAFDVGRMAYGEDYESTQAVSPTFNRFHDRLARDLIDRFDLRHKKVVEVGCGQGEFVTMLAELGDNQGYGFDQVIRGEATSEKVTFVKDFYAEPYRSLEPDFVCCKMTLEHVHNVAPFLRSIRQTVGDRPQAVVFFMIPEITRILKLRAFWDVYYEHCSYFSPGSLARAFRHAGFDPIDVWCDYDDQYVLIAARPGTGRTPPVANEHPAEALLPEVERFRTQVVQDQARWRQWLEQLRQACQKTVLWGGGSKGVSLLTTLGIRDGIEYAVDINPRRAGTYIAGTGQEIVQPDFLIGYQPDVVIIMSPIYTAEISAQLERLGVRPKRLITAEAPEQLVAA
jgi:SAM-dependent methyltransferase